MTTFLRSCATVSVLFIAVSGFTAQAASRQTLNFTILRDGDAIGTKTYTIDTNGTETKVHITTDIKVKVLYYTVYKFTHDSKEIWRDNRLVSLRSTTDDDGTAKVLTAKAENGQITLNSLVKGQDRRQFAPALAVPASLWNPIIVKQKTIINTLDGRFMKITVTDIGLEQVEAGGLTIAAHHYKIRGELTRDLWYDAADRLVRISFPDKTSKKIIYTLN